jgi:eukaryotic-like serine/threonine-protein kinase
LISGKVPFAGETQGGILASIVADEPVPLRQLVPAVPPELDAVIMRCLAKDRTKRQPSVSVLAAELDPFTATSGPSAVRLLVASAPTLPPQKQRTDPSMTTARAELSSMSSSRARMVVLVAGAVLALGLLAAAALFSYAHRASAGSAITSETPSLPAATQAAVTAAPAAAPTAPSPPLASALPTETARAPLPLRTVKLGVPAPRPVVKMLPPALPHSETSQ